MSATRIEWADITINPVVGCSKCSPGCDNCYAERFAARLEKIPTTALKYAGVVDAAGKWAGVTSRMDLSVFNKLPNKPKRVFVGSMTDMFQPRLNDNNGEGMRAMLKAFWEYPQHTFMMLTKRPDRMNCDIHWLIAQDGNLPENLWLGVTICTSQELHKLDNLREIPAALRYISFEPLLSDPGRVNLDGIGWVICGGETGPGARPMHPDWVRGLRDQCQQSGVPFFFKKFGKFQLDVNGTNALWPTPKEYERLLDGREWNEVPQ